MDLLGKTGRWARNNILGLVAIFIALGGTAVAASVTSHDSVRVVAAKKKVKRGPPGPQGPQGIQGPAGPATGTAGGDLTGNYPNPTISTGAVGTSKFGTIPAALLTGVAIQGSGCSFSATVPNNVQKPVNFFNTSSDTANLHHANACSGTIFDSLVAPVAGTYAITGQFAWDANATGDRKIEIDVDSGAVSDVEGPPVAEAGKYTQQDASAIVHMSQGQSVTLQVFQDSGSGLLSQGSSLGMSWLGP